jgi:hypothetical protein
VRTEQHRRDQELKALAERERKQAMTEDRARSLERQIQEKKMMQNMQHEIVQRDVNERFRQEQDYQNWL